MKQSEFIKTRVATYSKVDVCPKCHSAQCTCSAEVSAAPTTTEVVAVDETAKLDGVKTKLLGLIDFTAVDADVAESIKENIRKASKSDLLKMVKDEIEDVSKLSDSEAYVTGLKEVESELATFCGTQKTYSRTFEEIRDEVIEDSRKEYERYPEEFKDIKEGILDSSRDELYSNLLNELDVAVDEDRISFLKRITEELKSLGAQKVYSKSQKTYSKYDYIGEEIGEYNSLDELIADIRDSDEDLSEDEISKIKEFLDKHLKFPCISIVDALELTNKGEEITDKVSSMKTQDIIELDESGVGTKSYHHCGNGVVVNVERDPSGGLSEYLIPIDQLKTFSRKQRIRKKTYSVMSNYDIDLGNETKSIVSRYKGSVENLPEPKDDESGAEFFKRCLKWAKKVDKNPEPALADELVALGKKYKMEVE